MRPSVRGSSGFIIRMHCVRGEGIPAHAQTMLAKEVTNSRVGNEAALCAAGAGNASMSARIFGTYPPIPFVRGECVHAYAERPEVHEMNSALVEMGCAAQLRAGNASLRARNFWSYPCYTIRAWGRPPCLRRYSVRESAKHCQVDYD